VLFTHNKYIETRSLLKVKYVKIKKKNYTLKLLGIYCIVDRVLQLQLLTFLDPLIDSILPENFYGNRKGRSSLEAIAYFFHKSILLNNTFKYYVAFVSIQKCFDYILHTFILDKFLFPVRYKDLFTRWVKCFRVLAYGKKIKMSSGVSRSFVLGSIIYNFILAQALKSFCNRISCYTHTNGFIVGYADDFIIRASNINEVYSILKELKTSLLKVGLGINNENIYGYSSRLKVKFDWLGYTFVAFPIKSVHEAT
jgi:retron-type reverse transcriptase